jgi:hypothetical protein
MIALAVSVHVDRRREFIENHKVKIPKTRERLEELRQPGTRIAFWDGSPGNLLGEVSFHVWGNYMYANDYFDQLLIRKYPHYTFFRLREVRRLIREKIEEQGMLGLMKKREPRERGSSFGWLGRSWRKVFPHPYPDRTNEIVAGEKSGVRVSVIAFPEDEALHELGGVTQSELLSFIQERFGTPRVWKESIGGVGWLLISVSG